MLMIGSYLTDNGWGEACAPALSQCPVPSTLSARLTLLSPPSSSAPLRLGIRPRRP